MFQKCGVVKVVGKDALLGCHWYAGRRIIKTGCALHKNPLAYPLKSPYVVKESPYLILAHQWKKRKSSNG